MGSDEVESTFVPDPEANVARTFAHLFRVAAILTQSAQAQKRKLQFAT